MCTDQEALFMKAVIDASMLAVLRAFAASAG
jgi:hypothetical protein